jgi:hypothetical protein
MLLMAFSRGSMGMLLMLFHRKRVTSGSRVRIAWKAAAESFVALRYDASVIVLALFVFPIFCSALFFVRLYRCMRYWYKITNYHAAAPLSAQFTCFTGTNAQIVTQHYTVYLL